MCCMCKHCYTGRGKTGLYHALQMVPGTNGYYFYTVYVVQIVIGGFVFHRYIHLNYVG